MGSEKMPDGRPEFTETAIRITSQIACYKVLELGLAERLVHKRCYRAFAQIIQLGDVQPEFPDRGLSAAIIDLGWVNESITRKAETFFAIHGQWRNQQGLIKPAIFQVLSNLQMRGGLLD